MENLKRPIKKAVFPVAGLGTRLLPATKVMPKEMLTIVDRPLIQLAVEEACESGIEEFIFVISEGKDILIQHFQEAPSLMETLRARGKYDQISKIDKINFSDSALKFVRQDKPLGLGHAVWCARDLVGNEPFAVILPDDTVLSNETCLKQMMGGYHKMGGNLIASCEVPIQDTSRYGVFKMIDRKDNTFTVQDLVEKPGQVLRHLIWRSLAVIFFSPKFSGFLMNMKKGLVERSS
jgi:UTP--glucose-1-phosphate uridylyltransferase